MTTLAEVSDVARNLVRDFGTYFEVNFADNTGATLRLPHPLVDADTLAVINNADSTALTVDTDYSVNDRNGLVKLADASLYASGVSVNGLYYQWFLPADLEFHAQLVSHEHTYHRTGVVLQQISGVEVEVMGIGTVVSALWALLTELSTDIDVSSPEGMNIPAHQRFQQVQQLITYWTKQYEEKAAMLNIGLKRIEQFTLRRQSRLTNRYVPLYRVRELDNPRPPIRVRPPIDPIEPTPYETEEEVWSQQYDDMNVESGDLGYGGWGSAGTSGGYP